jgi:hypothetical protein
VPGASVGCVGVHGCTGYQVCRTDGSGYDACSCGDGGLIKAFPSYGPYSGLLGAACTVSDDCRKGLDCFTPSTSLLNGEGPSAGMCLAKCLSDHDFCNGLDATAKCVVLDDGGTPAFTSDDVSYCFPGCKLGKQPADADKCRGRVDLVCVEEPVGAGAGYCKPACRSDVDCAPEKCDLATGLCANSARSGDALGADCQLSNSQCAGACYPVNNTYSACSGFCSYGTPGCGQSGDPPYKAFCSIPGAATATAGAGDIGFCGELCDCDTDCGRADAVCEPQPAAWTKTTGRKGLCGSKTLPSGSPRKNLACP